MVLLYCVEMIACANAHLFRCVNMIIEHQYCVYNCHARTSVSSAGIHACALIGLCIEAHEQNHKVTLSLVPSATHTVTLLHVHRS
jgi:hypothetical protein